MSQVAQTPAKRTFPKWSIYFAFGAFGLAMVGMMAGSESKVRSLRPFITGVTGIAAAVSVLWFTRKKEEAEIPDEQKGALAIGIVWFSIATIIGVLCGVSWRMRHAREIHNAQLRDVPHYVVSNKRAVPPAEVTSLILLQTILQSQNIPNADNNGLITKLADDYSEKQEAFDKEKAIAEKALIAQYVANVRTYDSDLESLDRHLDVLIRWSDYLGTHDLDAEDKSNLLAAAKKCSDAGNKCRKKISESRKLYDPARGTDAELRSAMMALERIKDGEPDIIDDALQRTLEALKSIGQPLRGAQNSDLAPATSAAPAPVKGSAPRYDWWWGSYGAPPPP